MQEFRKISVVAEQHDLTEFPGMDILKASYLLAGTDAGTNRRPQIFPVIGTLFTFLPNILSAPFCGIPTVQNWMVSGAAVKEEKVAVAFLK